MKRILSLFIVLWAACLSAAGPVTHAYLTERFLEIYPKNDELDTHAFMIGSLFPDIRYLGTIAREKTHYTSMTLEEVLNEPSPFLAGIKFHSYVDLTREAFISEHQIYLLLDALLTPNAKVLHLKLLEDELLFSKINGPLWQDYVERMHPEELNWGVELNQICHWHTILCYCFKYHPSDLLHVMELTNKKPAIFTSNELTHWRSTLNKAAYSQPIKSYIEALITYYNAQFTH